MNGLLLSGINSQRGSIQLRSDNMDFIKGVDNIVIGKNGETVVCNYCDLGEVLFFVFFNERNR